MTRKEKIINVCYTKKVIGNKTLFELIESSGYKDYAQASIIDKLADAILSLPIDVPSEEEIENYCINENHGNTRMGAKWAINEILKRNKTE